MAKKMIPVLLLLALIAGAAVGWFLLPDPVRVQFGGDRTMPRLLVLGLVVAIGAFGAVQAAGGEERDRRGGYIMMVIAAAVLGLTFWVNC